MSGQERVARSWARACALAGFQGSGSSIGGQVDAVVEPLSGAERTAVRSLLCEAWRLIARVDDVEGAAEHVKLAAALLAQAGRVEGALKAAQAVEEALFAGDDTSRQDGHILTDVRDAMAEAGFFPAPLDTARHDCRLDGCPIPGRCDLDSEVRRG